jgi:hypothetical protein
MGQVIFAQGGSVSFFREWGDVASVLSFLLSLSSIVVSLVGFFLTLRGQRKIRQATDAAVRRAAYQIAAAEAGSLLAHLQGMHDAVLQQHWLTAIFRGREARLVMLSLRNNSTLTEDEQAHLRRMADTIRLVVQYVERRLLPQGHGAGTLAVMHRRELDRILGLAGELRGRLQHTQLEV